MMPKNREPSLPGEILSEEFLKPMKMTQAQLAEKSGVGLQTINLLINGKRAVTAETALAFSRVFETTAQFWMNLQNAVDLWNAQQRLAKQPRAEARSRRQ